MYLLQFLHIYEEIPQKVGGGVMETFYLIFTCSHLLFTCLHLKLTFGRKGFTCDRLTFTCEMENSPKTLY